MHLADTQIHIYTYMYIHEQQLYTNRGREGRKEFTGLDANSPVLLEGPLFAVGDEGVEGQGLQQTLEHCMEVT